MYKNMKTTFLLSLVFLLGLTSYAQGKAYDDLYAKFDEIPNSMSSVELKEKMKSTITLDAADQKIIDQTALSDEIIVPIGKYQSGKNMILIFAIVDTKWNKLHMHEKTISMKSGEIIHLTHYLLSIAKEADMAYDGSFKRDADIIIFTNDEETNGEWHATQTKYKLGKHLEYIEKN
jgi:hypothetical protein